VSAPGPLRVLLLTTSLIRGGAETQVFLLAKAFRLRGHRVHVVSMLEPEAYVSELAELDVELSSLGLRRGASDPRAVPRLAALVRRWRPQVVHSHMVHANLLARAARPFGWAPVQLSTAHNLTEGARWREIAYRVTDPLCTLTTNVCRAGAQRYVQVGAVPRRKMRPMPNGIVVEALARPAATRRRARSELGVGARFLWLAVGRLERQKDVPTMLAALARRREDGSEARLAVVGEGPLRDELLAERDRLGLDGGTVRFLGRRSDVPDLMAAADGYLMSSAWEGLPLVLLEASAARLPIVATDVGGNDEIVTHGGNGFLAPPHEPEALAAAMARLEGMPVAERSALGEAGLAHVRASFDIERVADRWIELYRELLGDAERD
jgi:glycosyltransferase involved in cell wall biosynthesis